MALENTILTPVGDDITLEVYNRHALIDYAMGFTYEDDGSPFAFTGYSSGFFRIYDTRDQSNGKRVKNFTTQVSRNGSNLIFNCSVSDMTFSYKGKYYYEIGYVRSGGYDIVLRYGELIVK